MNRGVKIGIAAALAILVPFGIYAAIGIKMLTQICYKISGFKLLYVDFKKVSFELKIKVKNPSKIKVEIHGYDLGIKINGTKVGTVSDTFKTVLESKQVTEVTVPITVQLDKVFDKVKSQEVMTLFLTRNLSKLLLSVNGKFIGEVLKYPISTNINIAYTIADIQKTMNEPSMPCDIK